MSRTLLPLALLLALTACDATERPSPAAVLAPFLGGEDRLCFADADCHSTVCSYGVCAGLASADRPWMTDAITDALAARLEAGDVTLTDLRAAFARALDPDGTPDLRRARLLRGWARVDAAGAAEAAGPLFQDVAGAPILRFEAARVRLAARDAEAEAWLVERVRAKGVALVPFLVPWWRFFAPSSRATILDLVTARGDAALRARLLTLDP